LALFDLAHGDHAARIHCVVGDIELLRHTTVVITGDEGGVVVGDDCGSVFGEIVEHAVGCAGGASQIKDITDACLSQPPRGLRNTFENERVETVIGVRVGAGEAFVVKDGEVVAIGKLGGIEQSVVGIYAPIHLGPIENVFAFRALRRGV
jgi:hypothetical protein